jgi:hypothetical protein
LPDAVASGALREGAVTGGVVGGGAVAGGIVAGGEVAEAAAGAGMAVVAVAAVGIDSWFVVATMKRIRMSATTIEPARISPERLFFGESACLGDTASTDELGWPTPISAEAPQGCAGIADGR